MIPAFNTTGKDWLAIKDQLNQWIEEEKNKMVDAKTWEDFLRMQGRVRAFLSVIGMEVNPGASNE